MNTKLFFHGAIALVGCLLYHGAPESQWPNALVTCGRAQAIKLTVRATLHVSGRYPQ